MYDSCDSRFKCVVPFALHLLLCVRILAIILNLRYASTNHDVRATCTENCLLPDIFLSELLYCIDIQYQESPRRLIQLFTLM